MRLTLVLVAGLLLAACSPPQINHSDPQSAPQTAGPSPRVKVGLERLGEYPQLLSNRRLGLVVHAASVTFEDQHAIDVTREAGLEVVRLFAPEHGLRGRSAAGELVDNHQDPISGLPVVSLYGEQRRPSLDDLADLDALVFDLQGAGVRFYTYVSTLILCLQAAAEADLEIVVLDRPNPLSGERIEGPLAAPRATVPESFVNMAPGPLVHGLTLGEMARYVNSQQARPAKLTVIPMTGWLREMTWTETGRQWIPPSPNLRTAEAAMAYPGVALLEASNVSEGRGTDAPFLYAGAPWLIDQDLASLMPTDLAGFRLEPVHFTPLASTAAPQPKYRDQECGGWRISVASPATASPYRLGLEVLTRLSQNPAFTWQRQGQALIWLTGTPRLYEDLLSKRSVEEILAADARDHRAWSLATERAKLY